MGFIFKQKLLMLVAGLSLAFTGLDGAIADGKEAAESVLEATDTLPKATEEAERKRIVDGDASEWIENVEDLPVAPYKDKLDRLLMEEKRTSWGLSWTDYMDFENNVWIDCGAYYKLKNIDIVWFYDDIDNGGLDLEVLAHFEELYVRKDGEFIFDGESFTIEEWDENHSLPRWSLKFDEKGYIIGFEDLSVS